MRKREEHSRREDLPGLHALQRIAAVIAATAEWRMLEDHRTGAGDLAGDREALDQPQEDEQRRGEHPDLLIRRQERDRHRRGAHQEHAEDQYILAAMRVAPVPEEERADRPRNVADAVGRQ